MVGVIPKRRARPEQTPATNLLLTILDKMGVPVDKMSDSTGKLDLLTVG